MDEAKNTAIAFRKAMFFSLKAFVIYVAIALAWYVRFRNFFGFEVINRVDGAETHNIIPNLTSSGWNTVGAITNVVIIGSYLVSLIYFYNKEKVASIHQTEDSVINNPSREWRIK
jgi:hypothetical protein